MASYFGEIIEPCSRALFEEVDSTIDVDDQSEKSELKIDWKTSNNLCPSFETIAIVCGKLALAFVEAYLTDTTRTEIGSISLTKTVESQGNKKENSVHSPLILQGNILYCFINPSLQSDIAVDFTSVISPIAKKTKEVIILTSQVVNNNSELPDNAVYSCATKEYKKSLLRPILPNATILSCIGAAVLSWCEIFSVPAVLYVAYSDSNILDSIRAKPLIGILPTVTASPNLKQKWRYGGSSSPVGHLSNMYL